VPVVECGFLELSSAGSPAEALVQYGPTVPVDIGFDPAMFAAAYPAAGFRRVPEAHSVPALIDTGSSESYIDEELAQRLQLPLVDQVQVDGAQGEMTLNVYLAHIALPGLGATQHGRLCGLPLKTGTASHRIILGRTLLKDTLLIYDGRSGSVKLAK
jgi:hypothetical protein